MAIYVNTKLGKALFLKGHARLSLHVPTTVRATEKGIRTLLQRYRMVYIKPNVGAGGHGVIKAEMEKNGEQMEFRYKLGTQIYKFTSFAAFYTSLRRAIGAKSYLAQQGIHMLTVNNRPFDIRVMVQRNENGGWEHTGSIGRIAHPKRIVTNCHFGGDAKTVKALLVPYLGDQQSARYEEKLRKLGLDVAGYMQKGYPRVNELGLDVGIDGKHRMWIFEVNTKPDPFIFKRLHQPKVFRRILRLSQLHGRYLKKI